MKTTTVPAWMVNLFFVIGLISALLFRVLIFINAYYPAWSRLVWYSGVLGYLLFFGYRYYISHKRRRVILQGGLIAKITAAPLAQTDKDELLYVLQSILKSKEMFNYIFIFAVSLLAIILDIALMLWGGAG